MATSLHTWLTAIVLTKPLGMADWPFSCRQTQGWHHSSCSMRYGRLDGGVKRLRRSGASYPCGVQTNTLMHILRYLWNGKRGIMDKVLGVVREQKYGGRHPFPEFADVVSDCACPLDRDPG